MWDRETERRRTAIIDTTLGLAFLESVRNCLRLHYIFLNHVEIHISEPFFVLLNPPSTGQRTDKASCLLAGCFPNYSESLRMQLSYSGHSLFEEFLLLCRGPLKVSASEKTKRQSYLEAQQWNKDLIVLALFFFYPGGSSDKPKLIQPLCRGVRAHPATSALYMTINNLIMRLPSWISRKCAVPLHCHHSQIHSERSCSTW